MDDDTSPDVTAEDAMLDIEVDLEDSGNEPAETEDQEDDDVESDSLDDLLDADDEAEAEPEADTEDVETPPEDADEPAKAAKAPKTPEATHSKEMFDKRWAEKERQQELENAQVRYLNESEDADELDSRQQEINHYNKNIELEQREEALVTQQVEINNANLQSQFDRAATDFSILNSDDPFIQKQLGNALDLFEAKQLVADGKGGFVKVNGDFYAFLQETATDLSDLTGIKSEKQSQAKDKQKSKAMTTPSRSPKEPKSDPDIDAFDEAAKAYM